jgi:adenylate cyclase
MWKRFKDRIQHWQGILSIAPTVAVVTIAGSWVGTWQLLEWASIDRFFALRQPEPVDSRIAIVTIDEADIDYIGQWPMPDGVMAEAIANIRDRQPTAIGIDIYRDLPLEPGHQSLEKIFKSTPNLIGIQKVAGETVDPPPILAKLEQVAASDTLMDEDGKVRRGLILLGTKDKKMLNSLGTKLALMYLEQAKLELEVLDPKRKIYRMGKAIFHPLTEKDSGYVRGDTSGYQILLNYRGHIDKFVQVPLRDVLENKVPADIFRDRLVFVGATTPSLKDIFATPYSAKLLANPKAMPGIVIHANMASQILSAALDGRPLLRSVSTPLIWGWIAVWSSVGTGGIWFLLQSKRVSKNTFFVVTLGGIAVGGLVLVASSYLAFTAGFVIPVFSPLLALTASAILTNNYHNQWKLRQANRQLAATNNQLESTNDELAKTNEKLEITNDKLAITNDRLEQANTQLEEYSRTLEQKVSERTQELSEAMKHLEATQEELIHSEKMAALGQLIAGVAHEVNTPLGAIRSSIGNVNNFLTQTLDELPEFFKTLPVDQTELFLELLNRSSQRNFSISSQEKRKFKRALRKELEAKEIEQVDSIADTLVDIGVYENIEPFLPLLTSKNSDKIFDTAYQLSGLKESAQNIKVAIDRAAKVVFALKTYARYDSSGEKLKVNIVDGIETILTLYQNQLKQGVEVVRNYQDLPAILCYADELNQVWTNLVHNALQAMDNRGTLTIDAYQQNGSIQVTIADNGKGIPPEVLPKIFQPFFTTKPPGEGSGLGLDIVRKIVEKHEGKISVQSVPGKTEFTVSIPIPIE